MRHSDKEPFVTRDWIICSSFRLNGLLIREASGMQMIQTVVEPDWELRSTAAKLKNVVEDTSIVAIEIRS